ncbi:MAG: DsbA family oxidoreductase [Chloroflexota bacterium]
MRIDVYHDIACPWCWIGKAHLQEALAQWDADDDITITYHPFFLNAHIPAEGTDFTQYMLAKGNYRMAIEDFFAPPREMGKRAGLTFNFEAIEYAVNTLHAHRLVSFVPENKQPALLDALYAAYFEHGQNVGDVDVLADIAETCGYDRTAMYTRLMSDENKDIVQKSMQRARQIGITGVPFFVMNERLAFSGAQPAETILRVMQQATDLAHNEANTENLL